MSFSRFTDRQRQPSSFTSGRRPILDLFVQRSFELFNRRLQQPLLGPHPRGPGYTYIPPLGHSLGPEPSETSEPFDPSEYDAYANLDPESRLVQAYNIFRGINCATPRVGRACDIPEHKKYITHNSAFGGSYVTERYKDGVQYPPLSEILKFDKELREKQEKLNKILASKTVKLANPPRLQVLASAPPPARIKRAFTFENDSDKYVSKRRKTGITLAGYPSRPLRAKIVTKSPRGFSSSTTSSYNFSSSDISSRSISPLTQRQQEPSPIVKEIYHSNSKQQPSRRSFFFSKQTQVDSHSQPTPDSSASPFRRTFNRFWPQLFSRTRGPQSQHINASHQARSQSSIHSPSSQSDCAAQQAKSPKSFQSSRLKNDNAVKYARSYQVTKPSSSLNDNAAKHASSYQPINTSHSQSDRAAAKQAISHHLSHPSQPRRDRAAKQAKSHTTTMPGSMTTTPPPALSTNPLGKTTPNTISKKRQVSPSFTLSVRKTSAKHALPSQVRTSIAAHLSNTGEAARLQSALLTSLQRKNWAQNVRILSRDLLRSGKCTTYPEVMEVVIAACTSGSRRELRKDSSVSGAGKRGREADVEDDEFVEKESVGARRKRVKIEKILGELEGGGVVYDLAIPTAVVEEGVGLLKGMLREVVAFEE